MRVTVMISNNKSATDAVWRLNSVEFNVYFTVALNARKDITEHLKSHEYCAKIKAVQFRNLTYK